MFKRGCTLAAESREVPLEIFSNPTILSDDNLFKEGYHFFIPPAPLATMIQPSRPCSLNPGVGVTEDDPTVSAGLDQVTALLTHPSLCHEGVAGIDHAR